MWCDVERVFHLCTEYPASNVNAAHQKIKFSPRLDGVQSKSFVIEPLFPDGFFNIPGFIPGFVPGSSAPRPDAPFVVVDWLSWRFACLKTFRAFLIECARVIGPVEFYFGKKFCCFFGFKLNKNVGIPLKSSDLYFPVMFLTTIFMLMVGY